MYLNSPSMMTGLMSYLTGSRVHVDKEIEKGCLILPSD
jgi:hypothetical protein